MTIDLLMYELVKEMKKLPKNKRKELVKQLIMPLTQIRDLMNEQNTKKAK